MAITHIHGDSFDYTVPMPSSFSPGYFVGWTVTSQVRTSQYQKLVSDLVCTWQDPSTTMNLKLFKLSTSDWPVGPCVMDVQFVRNSDKYTFSSSVETVNVVKDVTTPDGMPV